jgi:hypothetical protein
VVEVEPSKTIVSMTVFPTSMKQTQGFDFLYNNGVAQYAILKTGKYQGQRVEFHKVVLWPIHFE